MIGWVRRYTRWLHTGWPAGKVERLPMVRLDGSTNIPGLFVVGDLTGVPLLKFASDTGARAVQTILADCAFQAERASAPSGRDASPVYDLAIVGGGVAGMAAALQARKAGISLVVLEASEPFSTIVNFPKAKPIFTYPTEMTPAGELQFTQRSSVKEGLLDELRDQARAAGIVPRIARAERVRRHGKLLEVVLAPVDAVGTGAVAEFQPLLARRVIVAIGQSGNFRRLGVPGEDLPKVYNRLHDPKDFCDRDVLVVGGGDSALETAIAIAACGGRVTVSYRKAEFSRPKPENLERLQALLADSTTPATLARHASQMPTTAAGPFVGERRGRGSVRVMMSSRVVAVGEREVRVADVQGAIQTLPNDAVFTMIGREAPLDFFRRSGVPIQGEWSARRKLSLAAVLLFCVFLYHWKTSAGIPVYEWFKQRHWFPFGLQPPLDPSTLGGTLGISMTQPSFYYSLAYCVVVVIFGIRRMRRRKTPYVRAQTMTLMAIQVVPLFLLPYVILPWAGHNGGFGEWWESEPLRHDEVESWRGYLQEHPHARFDESRLINPDESGRIVARLVPASGWRAWRGYSIEARGPHRLALRILGGGVAGTPPNEVVLDLSEGRAAFRRVAYGGWLANQLFPISEWDPQGREYWRSLGFVLAWPLFFWNVFTGKPLWVWLAISVLQTAVLIPLIIRKWGKGAYCGWICSCGALAETLGDAHRKKMPHGPRWNRLNMLGQVILVLACVLLVLRAIGWLSPGDGWVNQAFRAAFEGKQANGAALVFPFSFLNYVWSVDLLLAGILGVGLYFHFSGRMWCRFACPLAALMHVYARFSRFRILADKKKCISCNVCTSVCHQGIDVMNFANKGLPMADVECVRCSACVQMCPTGVLAFGEIDLRSGRETGRDQLAASPVQMSER
jgi:thioredoxin reductase/ferredoxin